MVPSKIYFWKDFFLYAGSGLTTQPHAHHALQIVVSVNAPFRILFPGQPAVDCQALIIGPNQAHSCQAEQSSLLFFNLYPESILGKQLEAGCLHAKLYRFLARNNIAHELNPLIDCLHEKTGQERLYQQAVTFLRNLAQLPVQIATLERIWEECF